MTGKSLCVLRSCVRSTAVSALVLSGLPNRRPLVRKKRRKVAARFDQGDKEGRRDETVEPTPPSCREIRRRAHSPPTRRTMTAFQLTTSRTPGTRMTHWAHHGW